MAYIVQETTPKEYADTGKKYKLVDIFGRESIVLRYYDTRGEAKTEKERWIARDRLSDYVEGFVTTMVKKFGDILSEDEIRKTIKETI